MRQACGIGRPEKIYNELGKGQEIVSLSISIHAYYLHAFTCKGPAANVWSEAPEHHLTKILKVAAHILVRPCY